MTDGPSDAFKWSIGDKKKTEDPTFQLGTTQHTIEGKLILTEGAKYDSGKPTTALLPSKPLLEVAKVLDFGAKKYDSHNWRKGINYSRVFSAAQRHLLAWNEGEDLDKETNISHLAHAACNILFLLEYTLSGKVDFDDRYKKEE